jgi:hypothetical protein
MGFILSVLIVMYTVHIRYNPFALNLLESLFSIAILIIWLGLVIGLKYNRLGAWINLFGIAICYLLKYWVSGILSEGWIFALLALPGLLYLTCYALERPVPKVN